VRHARRAEAAWRAAWRARCSDAEELVVVECETAQASVALSSALMRCEEVIWTRECDGEDGEEEGKEADGGGATGS
jgi:hypothetical protein